MFLFNKRKTADLIVPKLCVGPHMTPGKVYGWSDIYKLAYNKIQLLLSHENPQYFCLNPPISFYKVCRENVVHFKKEICKYSERLDYMYMQYLSTTIWKFIVWI